MKLIIQLLLLLIIPLASAHITVEPASIEFSVEGEQRSVDVTITRTVTYEQAFINTAGEWTPITLSNEKKRTNWHVGTTTTTQTIREVDTRNTREAKIATFSCAWNEGWQCPNDWEITIIPATLQEQEEQEEEQPQLSSDEEALAQLYQETNGESWTNNEGWLQTSNLADWYGVETNQQGRVTKLDLRNNNLQGQLPPAIAQLSELEYLNVKQNQLTGEIPPEIGRLNKLKTLLLSGVAADPPTNTGHNIHQGKSDDSGNTFSGSIPPEIGQLSNLEILELSGSEITGTVPKEIGQLTNLRFLAMSWNPQLTGPLPDEIGNLQNLVWMYFRASGLTGELPATMSNLHSLRTIHLGNGNSLTGELPDFSGLTQLRNFNVDNNDFTGQWPAYWNNGDFDLIGLRGTWNNFEGDLHGFENLPSLVSFDVTGNRGITGTIQGAEGLSNIVIFGVGWNKMTGELPDMSQWTKLRTLYFNDNAFTGGLPAGLGNVDAPTSNLNIYMGENQLTGSIPQAWSSINVGSFNHLQLHNNQLTGEIPSQLANLNIGSYTVHTNKFVFADLIPTIQQNPESFSYQPQKVFGQATSQTTTAGSNFNYDFQATTHSNNQYQWYKANQAISGQTNRALSISSATSSDAGEYTLRVTNNQVPDLQLTSQPLTLVVQENHEDLSHEILPGSTLEDTEHGRIYRKEIANGINGGWAIAFLPDSRMLLTEKIGNVRIVTLDGDISAPLNNVPRVHPERQGGLLDLVLHPDFENNGWVYMSYAGIEEVEGEERYMTHLARARFVNDDLQELEVLFRGQNPTADTNPRHYGSRITFDHQGYLYMTIGDRRRASWAQNTLNHAGTVIRLHDDGSIPSDNPFIGNNDYLPEIYSYGHRNSQGLTTHPWTGEVWENMHGPQGGDEVNVIFAGANYGWPLYTTGVDYGGGTIGYDEPPEGTIPPVHNWTPSIAPSGITFYTGSKLAPWRGNLLNGALANQERGRRISRLVLDGHEIIHEEHILNNRNQRIRDVRQGPDEYIYYLTDGGNGRIYRLGPFEQ